MKTLIPISSSGNDRWPGKFVKTEYKAIYLILSSQQELEVSRPIFYTQLLVHYSVQQSWIHRLAHCEYENKLAHRM